MEQNQTLFRHTMIYGLVIGGIMVAYQFLLFIFGMTNNGNMASIVSFLEIMGLLISIKQFRDKVQDGVITFGRAFSVGVYTSFFIGVVGSIYAYILYKFLSPGLLGEVIVEMKKAVDESTLPQDQVEIWHKMLSMISPVFISFFDILGIVIWGTFFSLLIAFMLRKEIRRIG